MQKELIQSRSITHNMNRTPEFYAYYRAKKRCKDGPETSRYKDYRGRGIQFLYSNVQEFIDDVGLRPGPGYSLDRIDNDGNYEPGNCRWATAKEQQANQRRKRLDQFSIKQLLGEIEKRCEGAIS